MLRTAIRRKHGWKTEGGTEWRPRLLQDLQGLMAGSMGEHPLTCWAQGLLSPRGLRAGSPPIALFLLSQPQLPLCQFHMVSLYPNRNCWEAQNSHGWSGSGDEVEWPENPGGNFQLSLRAPVMAILTICLTEDSEKWQVHVCFPKLLGLFASSSTPHPLQGASSGGHNYSTVTTVV